MNKLPFPLVALAVGCLALGPTMGPAQQAEFRTVNAFGPLTFTDPVAITSPPQQSNTVFVVEQRGVISVVTNLAAPTRTVFMDISARVSVLGSASDERGCLGLAFHPGYETNHLFFVFYTTSGTLFDRLSRFQASADFSQGLPNSEVILINQADNQGNHNGGDLHFGPDGYLYVSLGDEGGANDSEFNSQRINGDFFSAIMRLDVDPEKRSGNLPPNVHVASSTNYAIPMDNPYVGATTFNNQLVDPANVRTEFWAVGLRNPWRMSFDPATGRLYCGDVGQGTWEEIDIITRGGNYGWAYRQGDHSGPRTPPAGLTFIPPIYEYSHGNGEFQGFSVSGGVVYRGRLIPTLRGHYVFADYVSDHIWAFLYDGNTVSQVRSLVNDADIAAFGVDPTNGDILLADRNDDTIKRLIYVEPSALEVTVVPTGSMWKYLDNGSNQGTAWQAPFSFDDTLWASGPAELGYGDTDEATTLNGGPSGNRIITTYFRHAFEVSDPDLYTSLTVNLLRDDGGVVYLNGTEVFRSNMPQGPITSTTTAIDNISGTDETVFYGQSVSPELLAAGVNVLAVEMHQQNVSSSDVSFDLSLVGEVRPTIEITLVGETAMIHWTAPAPGYLLWSAEDPQGPWAEMSEEVTIEDGRASVSMDIDSPVRYFRLAR